MSITIARTPWNDEVPDVSAGTPIDNAAKQELYDQIDAALADVVDAIAAGPGGGPGGSGTVTHAGGALTVNRLVVGNAGADLTVLGSLGTVATVLHGNAVGPPGFGPVSLATDVSGTLLAAQEPAHTGDVTNAAGSLALAIGAGKVTNAMLAGAIAASKLVGSDLSLAESQVVNLVSDLAALAAAVAGAATLPITNAMLAGAITASKLVGSDLVLTEAQITSLVADLALKAPIASPTLTGVPAAPTAAAATNTTQLATTAFVQAAVAALVASAPGTLDTLNELAVALGNDPSFATTIATSLGLKAPIASPTFTGTPAAPTAAPGTNTTQLATTAFVAAVNALLAPLASPALTGTPTAPTAAPGVNTTQLATTAFAGAAVAVETAARVAADALLAPLASPALTGTPTAPTAAAGTSTTQLATTAFVQTPVVQSTTSTGTVNDFALTAGARMLRCNNATLLTLTGLTAGADGQLLHIESIGAGQVDLANQAAGSTAANRLINAVAATISLAPGVGTATLQYDATTARWRVVQHVQGAWIAPVYNGGDFTGNGSMTWTVDSGDIFAYAYLLIGKTVFVAFDMFTTSVGGTLNYALQIKVPGGFTSAGRNILANLCRAIDNGTQLAAGEVFVPATSTVIQILKPASANWTAATNTTRVSGLAIFEVA